MRARAQPNIAEALQLYCSTTIDGNKKSVEDLLNNRRSAAVYRQFLPALLESVSPAISSRPRKSTRSAA